MNNSDQVARRLTFRERALVLSSFSERPPDDPIWHERGHWVNGSPQDLHTAVLTISSSRRIINLTE